MPLRRGGNAVRVFVAAACAALLAACSAAPAQETATVADAAPLSADEMAADEIAKPRLGLFTTLPIYWGESDGIADILAGTNEPDWVRTQLETRFELVPLDTLEASALKGLDRVLLAQPRPLAPSENVAFDAYLAGGGTALIFADPMLTRHSEYGFGDKRRPQGVVLLSPILDRLGVQLQYDESQPEGERGAQLFGRVFPVNEAGEWVITAPAAAPEAEAASPEQVASRSCAPWGGALAVRCRNGKGEAILYADAALLDWEGEGPVPQTRSEALWALLAPLLENTQAEPAR